jgi:hypothetical protein
MRTFKHRTHAHCPAAGGAAAALALIAAAFVAGCAQTGGIGQREAQPAGLSQARDRYVTCVTTEAEKDAANPAGAEDIAVAAHARCWSTWDAYREAMDSGFARDARTREEKQFAHDKADAQLRQLEIETRRSVVDAIVQRTLTKKP